MKRVAKGNVGYTLSMSKSLKAAIDYIKENEFLGA